MFERGTPANTFSTFPTRRFRFIVDPASLTGLDEPYQGVARLIADLRGAECPVEVHLVIPQYLATGHAPIPVRLQALGTEVHAADGIPAFEADLSIPEAARSRLMENDPGAERARGLLALALAAQADGVVTKDPLLIDARYLLRQHHLVRVVPEEELGDVVEICARGHSIFWSAVYPNRRLTFDMYYQTVHWKASRLFTWFNSIQVAIKSQDLRQCLHSLLLNRYPLLLLSRDLVRFYDIQRDYFTRRGLMMRFAMAVGYHVTSFYLLLWGLLDHLTVIAKYARDMSIAEQHCGIRSIEFWKQFGPLEPGLKGFVESEKISEWTDLMADMRHAAAHRTIAIPTIAASETEESKKSDDEIRVILRKERPIFYAMMPEEGVRDMEPVMISLWRIRKMKALSQTMVFLRSRDGKAYFRDPVVSIDYDLSHATAVMDAFLCRLFGGVFGEGDAGSG